MLDTNFWFRTFALLVLMYSTSGGSRGFQRVSGGFKAFQWVSGGFSGFQGVSAGFRAFQGVSAGFRAFQRVSVHLPPKKKIFKNIGILTNFFSLEIRHTYFENSPCVLHDRPNWTILLANTFSLYIYATKTIQTCLMSKSWMCGVHLSFPR